MPGDRRGDPRRGRRRARRATSPAPPAILDRLIAAHPRLGGLQATRAALAMLAGDARGGARRARGGGRRSASPSSPRSPPTRSSRRSPPTPRSAPPRGARRPPRRRPPRPPAPAPVAGGTAPVSAANTAWNPATERLEPRFAFPAAPAAPGAARPPEARRPRHPARARPPRPRRRQPRRSLRQPRPRPFRASTRRRIPQLAFVAYAPAARAADLDYGLNDRLLFDRPTFGNSSTAVTGGPALAQPAAAGADPRRRHRPAPALAERRARNQLYVYPAHTDFGDETGDLFPANTPYLLVSRGSSGSDQPFLEAVAMILAAFRPDTKARLVEEGLIVPTVQMVFRRSLQNVLSREDYFSGAAHPAAFDGFEINAARMVSLANAIEPGAIPPQVRIRMLEEELGAEGVDYFGAGPLRAALRHPRRHRPHLALQGRAAHACSSPPRRPATRTAAPLAFHWRLLQGDPAQVAHRAARRRRPRPHHARLARPLPDLRGEPGRDRPASTSASSPTTACTTAPRRCSACWFPPDETRRYAPGPDGAPRIAAIDHADPARRRSLPRPDADGPRRLARRLRLRRRRHARSAGPATGPGARPRTSPPTGARILARGADGRPTRTAPVAYPLRRDADGRAPRRGARRRRRAPARSSGTEPRTGAARSPVATPARLQPRRLDSRARSRACCARPWPTSSSSWSTTPRPTAPARRLAAVRDPRLRLLASPANRGAAAARNLGLAAARGDLGRLPGQRRRVAAAEAREADGPPARPRRRLRRRLLRHAGHRPRRGGRGADGGAAGDPLRAPARHGAGRGRAPAEPDARQHRLDPDAGRPPRPPASSSAASTRTCGR